MLVPALSLFVVSLGFGVIVPLLPELARAGASSASVLSLVYAVYSAAKISSQVPAGCWVDRVGPRRVLNVGLGLFVLSLAGFLVHGNVLYFAAIRLLEGLGTGLVYPAVFAWGLRESTEGDAGKRIGLAVALGTSGLLLGPALGGLLAPWGTRLPVAVALGLALVVFAGVASQRPARHERPAVPRTLGAELRALGALGRNGFFLALMLPVAFNKLTFSAFQGLLPLYGPAFLGLGIRGVTGLFALTGIVFGASQGLAGWLADRFAPRTVVLALTPALLLALVAMNALQQVTGFALSYAAYVAASSIIFTATMKYAATAFGTKETYGGVFGVFATLTDLATIVGPLLFMGLYGWLARSVFLCMAAAGLPFAMGFYWRGRGPAFRSELTL